MGWLKSFLGQFGGRSDGPSNGPSGDVTEPAGDPARVAEVRAVLSDLRPLLAADGGDVELVAVGESAVGESWVELRLVGACRSCSLQATTLAAGIEPELRRRLDWVRDVRLR